MGLEREIQQRKKGGHVGSSIRVGRTFLLSIHPSLYSGDLGIIIPIKLLSLPYISVFQLVVYAY